MKVRQLLLPLLGLVVFVSPLQAKKKHHHNDDSGEAYTPPANEAYVNVNPDALPSASLQPFLDTHLDRVLAPLGQQEFSQTWIVAALKTNYANIMATAPANRKPAFAAAENVCDALTNAMAERQKAVDAWHGSSATHSSEVVQPRGGRLVGRQEMGNEDDFFRRSTENNWKQRLAALRQNVLMLGQRERALESQITVPPAPVAPAPTASAAGPDVTAPAAGAPR